MIGIAAVVLVVAVGKAGSARAQAELQALGDNLVWVEAGSRNVAGTRTGTHGTTTLTVGDADAIRNEISLIKSVSPQVDGNIQIIYGNHNWSTRYRGETPEYLRIKKWELARGAAFTDDDVEESNSNILIGKTVREQLFGEANPVGELVRIQGQLFQISGELVPKGQSADGRDQDDWVLLPYTTAQTKLRSRQLIWLDDILCSAIAPELVDSAIDGVAALLRQRHHIRPGDEDDFNIRRPDEIIKAQIAASDALALLLVSVASIALWVGGIGIMNVMLASVAQRTREIGHRLAVGAKESDVQAQFLGEAIVLSVFGGVFGIGLSVGGAFGFERVLGWPISIPPQALGLAVVFSVLVGVFFGFYPARKAAHLDPIEALRHE